MLKKLEKQFTKEVGIFRENGGTLSTMKAIRLGIHPVKLYAMRNSKVLEQMGRGIYRLSNLPPLTNPSFAIVMQKAPKSVLCLISALAFHEMTTQIPHEIYIAVRRGDWVLKIDYPPIRAFRFSGKAFSEGIEEHLIDGIKVRVYSREKTLADCFKYRNVVGLDTVLEALQNYWRSKWKKTDELTRFSKICRVDNVMKPYLEAIQG
jgi:predicted transcriptional regulator of viral defense system